MWVCRSKPPKTPAMCPRGVQPPLILFGKLASRPEQVKVPPTDPVMYSLVAVDTFGFPSKRSHIADAVKLPQPSPR